MNEKSEVDRLKILFISLGCDKNLVDSEVMLGILKNKGYEITDEETEAEVIVVNSCCFINDAKEESIQTILSMAQMKESGACKALIVAGCLAQRYQKEIREEIPEVDALIGTTGFERIAEVVEEIMGGRRQDSFQSMEYLPSGEEGRILTTGGYYSYLKIAEGCNKCCTYCIIPSIRGPYRSVPMEKLVARASLLAAQGVKELILVAQETTLYGMDLYGRKMLPKLLQELCQIPGLSWIRLLYCYPEEIDDALIAVMQKEKKICHYLDMPIQHCSDQILKRMGRRTRKDELLAVIEKLRKEIPDIALRTTLITGFPGETKEDQKELMDFVGSVKFDRLGVFTYSPEEGTPAEAMEDQIEEEVKAGRRDEIMCMQQEIAFQKALEMPGEVLEAMIEGKLPEDGVFIGRTYKDAPNVDGYIFVHADRELLSGDMVKVYVTGAKGYDLVGEIIENVGDEE